MCMQGTVGRTQADIEGGRRQGGYIMAGREDTSCHTWTDLAVEVVERLGGGRNDSC